MRAHAYIGPPPFSMEMSAVRFRSHPVLNVVNGLTVPVIVTQDRVDEMGTMELRPSDLWVVTFPKGGTTWTQQIIKLILSNGEDDERKLNEVVPYLEATNNPNPNFSYNRVDVTTMKSPRTFKSHFPCNKMPCGSPASTGCKYIYVARNPKDVAVSLYHHYLGFEYVDDLTWDEFFFWFMTGQVIYGSYFDHVLGWWEHRNDRNVLFLKYEDMHKDVHSCIKHISQFMGVELPPGIVDKIAEKSSFSYMKDNPGTNYSWSDHRRAPGSAPFMRKGIGDWKRYFTVEQSAECDALYQERFIPASLKFDFEHPC